MPDHPVVGTLLDRNIHLEMLGQHILLYAWGYSRVYCVYSILVGGACTHVRLKSVYGGIYMDCALEYLVYDEVVFDGDKWIPPADG